MDHGWKRHALSDWRTLMALSIAAALVLRVWVAIDPPFYDAYAYLLALPYAAFVYPVLAFARKSRIPGIRLLAAGCVWALAACLFHWYSEEQMAALPPYFLMLCLACFVCYPLAFVLPEERAERTLCKLSGLLIGLVAALSLLGLVAALTGATVSLRASDAFGRVSYAGGRLYAFLFPTAFAAACGLALLLIPHAYATAGLRCARALLLPAAALIYLAMALTGATVVLLVFAVCVAGLAALLCRARLSARRRTVRVLLSLAVALSAAAVCFGGQLIAKRAVDAMVQTPAIATAREHTVDAPALLAFDAAPMAAPAAAMRYQRPAAQAAGVETSAPPAAGLGFIELRMTLWRAAMRMFAGQPTLLLCGTSPMQAREWLAPYLPDGVAAANMRALPMQALVLYGVPGLLVTLAFAAFVLVHTVRLLVGKNGSYTALQRSLALVPLFCLLLDETDCLMTFTDAGGLMNPVFFLAAGSVVWLSSRRRATESAA